MTSFPETPGDNTLFATRFDSAFARRLDAKYGSLDMDDFLKDNFLSTELRVPSTVMGTNICSPLATNAIAGSFVSENIDLNLYQGLGTIRNHVFRTAPASRRHGKAGGSCCFSIRDTWRARTRMRSS